LFQNIQTSYHKSPIQRSAYLCFWNNPLLKLEKYPLKVNTQYFSDTFPYAAGISRFSIRVVDVYYEDVCFIFPRMQYLVGIVCSVL